MLLSTGQVLNPTPNPDKLELKIEYLGSNGKMALLWQNIKVGLLVGMFYSAYFMIQSTRTFKRVVINRINWGERS